jgi:hypothetical protein
MIDFQRSIGEIGEITRDGDQLKSMDPGDIDLRGDMDDVDTAQGNEFFDTGQIEDPDEEDRVPIRRSSRKVKQTSRS